MHLRFSAAVGCWYFCCCWLGGFHCGTCVCSGVVGCCCWRGCCCCVGFCSCHWTSVVQQPGSLTLSLNSTLVCPSGRGRGRGHCLCCNPCRGVVLDWVCGHGLCRDLCRGLFPGDDIGLVLCGGGLGLVCCDNMGSCGLCCLLVAGDGIPRFGFRCCCCFCVLKSFGGCPGWGVCFRRCSRPRRLPIPRGIRVALSRRRRGDPIAPRRPRVASLMRRRRSSCLPIHIPLPCF